MKLLETYTDNHKRKQFRRKMRRIFSRRNVGRFVGIVLGLAMIAGNILPFLS